MQFEIVKKGYDVKAVDEYVAVKEQERVDQLNTAKKRNSMLSEQIEDLETELKALRRNEGRVTQLLTDAQALVEETQRKVDAYRTEELEALARFRDKWTGYATQYLSERLGDFTAKLEEYREDYARRVQHKLNANLFLMADPLWQDYQAERARTEGFSDAPIHIEELIDRLQNKK